MFIFWQTLPLKHVHNFSSILCKAVLKTLHGLPITKSALHAQRGRPSGNEASQLEMESTDGICIRARRLIPDIPPDPPVIYNVTQSIIKI